MKLIQHWEAYRGPKDERVEAETNRIYKVDVYKRQVLGVFGLGALMLLLGLKFLPLKPTERSH